MATPDEILAAARTVVLVDCPSRSVPEALARAGFTVGVKGGAGPADFSVFEVDEAPGGPARGGPATGEIGAAGSSRTLPRLAEPQRSGV
ncbi:MAG TPA: hypothetical protein VFW71_05445 [Actinomycetota bacterium]|nr:hypothetical protein [Actinomycetota bacterium]